MKTTCEKCGADLEIDLEKLISFCPYCGSKLVLDDPNLAEIIAEKEKTKRVAITEEQKTRRKKIDSEQKEKEDKRGNIYVTILVASAISIPILGLGGLFIAHQLKVNKLEKLEIKIEEEIDAGDYDSAFIDANKLYLDDNYSWDEIRTWDTKRNALIDLITEKQKEAIKNDPNNACIGISAEDIKGVDATKFKTQLEELGFSNVVVRESTEKSGLFKKKGTIEHAVVAGTSDFNEDDYFKKDSEIILYYYY